MINYVWSLKGVKKGEKYISKNNFNNKKNGVDEAKNERYLEAFPLQFPQKKKMYLSIIFSQLFYEPLDREKCYNFSPFFHQNFKESRMA